MVLHCKVHKMCCGIGQIIKIFVNLFVLIKFISFVLGKKRGKFGCIASELAMGEIRGACLLSFFTRMSCRPTPGFAAYKTPFSPIFVRTPLRLVVIASVLTVKIVGRGLLYEGLRWSRGCFDSSA